MIRVCEGSSPPHARHMHGTSMSRERGRIKRALVTIVTANLQEMGVFSQEVMLIAPQVSGGTSVEFPLDASTLALWRQSECVAFGITSMQSASNHSVLVEFAVEDIEGEYTRLKGLQLEWVQELTTQPWGHRTFYVRDPDGNVLNFHTVFEEQHS